jgi:hypothetical protein
MALEADALKWRLHEAIRKDASETPPFSILPEDSLTLRVHLEGSGDVVAQRRKLLEQLLGRYVLLDVSAHKGADTILVLPPIEAARARESELARIANIARTRLAWAGLEQVIVRPEGGLLVIDARERPDALRRAQQAIERSDWIVFKTVIEAGGGLQPGTKIATGDDIKDAYVTFSEGPFPVNVHVQTRASIGSALDQNVTQHLAIELNSSLRWLGAIAQSPPLGRTLLVEPEGVYVATLQQARRLANDVAGGSHISIKLQTSGSVNNSIRCASL